MACLLASVLGAQQALAPARIRTFLAIPSAAQAGETLELRWSVTGTDTVRLEPWNQEFPSEGRVTYVLKERTIFWLHASNALGGQSLPLAVELLPTPAGATLAPVAEPAPPSPIKPATAERQRAESGGAWIQFAALAEQDRVTALLQDLEEITGGDLAVFEIPDPGLPGRTLQRVRMGPFRTVGEARARLRQLQPKLRRLRLRPIVATD